MYTPDEITYLKQLAVQGKTKDEAVKAIEERRKALKPASFGSKIMDAEKKVWGGALDTSIHAAKAGVEFMGSGANDIGSAFNPNLTGNEKTQPGWETFANRAGKFGLGAAKVIGGGVETALSPIAGPLMEVVKPAAKGIKFAHDLRLSYLPENIRSGIISVEQKLGKEAYEVWKAMPQNERDAIRAGTDVLGLGVGRKAFQEATKVWELAAKEIGVEAKGIGSAIRESVPKAIPNFESATAPYGIKDIISPPYIKDSLTAVKEGFVNTTVDSQFQQTLDTSKNLIKAPPGVKGAKSLETGEAVKTATGSKEVFTERKTAIADTLARNVPEIKDAVTITGASDPYKAFDIVDNYVSRKSTNTIMELNAADAKITPADLNTIKSDVRKLILADADYKAIMMQVGEKNFAKQLDIAMTRFADRAKYLDGLGDFYGEMVGMSNSSKYNLGEAQTAINGILQQTIRKAGGNFIERSLQDAGAAMSFQNEMKDMTKILEARDLIEANKFAPQTNTIKEFTGLVDKYNLGDIVGGALKIPLAGAGIAALGGKVARQLYRNVSGIMADMIQRAELSGKYTDVEVNRLTEVKKKYDSILMSDELLQARKETINPNITVSPDTGYDEVINAQRKAGMTADEIIQGKKLLPEGQAGVSQADAIKLPIESQSSFEKRVNMGGTPDESMLPGRTGRPLQQVGQTPEQMLNDATPKLQPENNIVPNGTPVETLSEISANLDTMPIKDVQMAKAEAEKLIQEANRLLGDPKRIATDELDYVAKRSPELLKNSSIDELSGDWFHGTHSGNLGKTDSFYSQSADVAGDYGREKVGYPLSLSKLPKSKLPKNPLVLDSKEDLVDLIGYKGDPFAPKLGDKQDFDAMAKAYAKSKGHDSILYRSGTFDEPELHVFGDTKKVPKKKNKK